MMIEFVIYTPILMLFFTFLLEVIYCFIMQACLSMALHKYVHDIRTHAKQAIQHSQNSGTSLTQIQIDQNTQSIVDALCDQSMMKPFLKCKTTAKVQFNILGKGSPFDNSITNFADPRQTDRDPYIKAKRVACVDSNRSTAVDSKPIAPDILVYQACYAWKLATPTIVNQSFGGFMNDIETDPDAPGREKPSGSYNVYAVQVWRIEVDS